SGGFQQPAPGDQWHGRAGVYLVPAPDADPATWLVNEPVTYKKCAACPKRVVASDKTRIDHQWVPARHTFLYPRQGEPRPRPPPPPPPAATAAPTPPPLPRPPGTMRPAP